MYKKLFGIFILGALLFVIVGCSSNSKKEESKKEEETTKEETTKQEPVKKIHISNLKIATVGTPPSLKEDRVEFEKIDLKKLKDDTDNLAKDFNAIFVMPELLSDAAADKYIPTYKSLKIPIFFIESKKDELPFINPAMSYENAPKIKNVNFAVGYLNTSTKKKENNYKTWVYPYFKNASKEDAVETGYNQIFETVNEVKSAKEKGKDKK